MYRILSVLLLLLTAAGCALAEPIAQWRGPNRDGVFPETGLLKSWPAEGPELLWSLEDLDKGYSSVTVTGNRVYVTGNDGKTEFLTALDLQGKRLWRVAYGGAVTRSYTDSRCTPTVEGDRVYVLSGQGELACINGGQGKIMWTVPVFNKFGGEYFNWEIAENLLLVDDKVICTPGGSQTTMVALNKNTGETVWQTKSLNDTTAFVSPILVPYGGKKIIVNVTTHYVLGVNAQDGNVLWQVDYHAIDTPTWNINAPKINCVTPLYHDGRIYITSGYDHTSVMFRLTNNGNGIEQVWKNPVLDCHHGQVVRIGNYIYGSNWLDNSHGNWCCLDWTTGETKYETEWETKGPVSAADGMLYCLDERRGNLALVKAAPDGFNIVSSIRVRPGRGPYWAQPVIQDGVLYIRHGEALLAYKI